MPGLTRASGLGGGLPAPRTGERRPPLAGKRAAPLGRIFPRCGNPACGSGPIRLWRSRRFPLFEGRWACSPGCLREMVEAAIVREGEGRRSGTVWTHRVPLRLKLLEQGWVSEEQLRQASRRGQTPLDQGGDAREWLLASGVLSEAAITRAISAQWNCPVLSLSGARPAEDLSAAVPAFLAEVLGAVPVRVSGGRLLYLAFAERIDRSLSYAVEHVTGLRVAAGIARESEFLCEQTRFLSSGRAPKVRFLEADDGEALAERLTRWIEGEQAVEARLARVHELWWLRIWRRELRKAALPSREAVEDLLATVGRAGRKTGEEN